MNVKIMTKFRWSFLILIVITFIGLSTVTYADESGIGFTYTIESNDNQIDKSAAYFDLMMKPSEEQTLKVNITNLTDNKQTIEASLDGAKTNSNGVIEYNAPNIKNDESLATSFTDIVSTENEITLEGQETKTLELKVKMPDIEYDGLVAGGLMLKTKETEGASQENTGGSLVKNEYAYLIAILLRENDTQLQPDLKYRETYAADRNYNNTIFTRISNIVPVYVKDMTMEVQITKTGNNEVLYEVRQTGIEMAPNSFIDLPISMNNDAMVPGKYTAKVKANINDKDWSWEEEFEITKKDAEKYNEKNSSLTQEKIDWKLIAIFVGLFLLIAGIVTVVFSFVSKKKKKSKKKKNKK